jgi:hypothetical protein
VLKDLGPKVSELSSSFDTMGSCDTRRLAGECADVGGDSNCVPLQRVVRKIWVHLRVIISTPEQNLNEAPIKCYVETMPFNRKRAVDCPPKFFIQSLG